MKKQKLKHKLMTIPFGVVASLAIASSAFASPNDQELVTPKNVLNSPIISIAQDYQSNNDEQRRGLLEEAYEIDLTGTPVWEDRSGETTILPDGRKVEYTSHKIMRSLGFYDINANRQDLIMYGVYTGDWQPYRAFEAKKSPAYFEIVDGKYEYSKVFYGNLIESAISNYNESFARHYDDKEKVAEILAEKKAYIEEYAQLFIDAPGVIPYVVGFNHNEQVANENGVPTVEKGFFDSKYNHPDVMDKGIFVKEDHKEKEDESTNGEDTVVDSDAENNNPDKTDATKEETN